MQTHSLENHPQARLLARLMSDLSEEYWCAGWLTDAEYALWADLKGETISGSSGWKISTSDREELRVAHNLANGWIVWSEKLQGPAFVYADDWLAHLIEKEAIDAH